MFIGSKRITNLKFNRRLEAIILAASISTSMLCCGKTVNASDDCFSVEQAVSNCQNNLIYVEVPDIYKEEIKEMLHIDSSEITNIDLAKIKGFNLTILEDLDLTWLRYCINLEWLNVIVAGPVDSNVFSNLEFLGEQQKLTELYLGTACNMSLTNENAVFLKGITSLKNLTIDGFSVEEGVIESLNNLEKLSLYLTSKGTHANHVNVDYKKLVFLKELNFIRSRPYDIAIWFTTDDYETLIDSGVKITTDNNNLDKIVSINKELDKIMAGLDLELNKTERTKYDKILSYVLVRLSYDEEISKTASEDIDFEKANRDFYLDGQLYGALERDSSICGNYAALLSALLNRADIESYYLVSKDHAWNMVNINESNYYVDPTELDNEVIYIKEYGIFTDDGLHFIRYNKKKAPEIIGFGYGELFDWYLENPLDHVSYKHYYDVENIPEYVEIADVDYKREKRLIK